MYAVFESGGKQHRVAEGDLIRLEKLHGECGDSVQFDKVLLIADGEDVKVGNPYVEGGRVAAEMLDSSVRSKKIPVVKFKRRKNYLRMGNHRQTYSMVKITSISTTG